MFMKKRYFGVLTCAALIVAMASSPASASISLTITPGTLNFDGGAPAIGNFSGVTLNGTPQLTSLAVDPFTVVDATGSGDGWNVLLTIPDLSDGHSHTIVASNISMTAPVVTAATTSDITNVVGNASAGNFATGEQIVTAAAGSGEGTYLVAPRILKLTIPVTTIAAGFPYTSAATIQTVDGP